MPQHFSCYGQEVVLVTESENETPPQTKTPRVWLSNLLSGKLERFVYCFFKQFWIGLGF